MNKLILLFLGLVLLAPNGINAQLWKPQVSGTTNDLFSLSFPVDENVGYICGTGGTILYTEDGGNNWEPQNSGTNFDLYEIHFINFNKGFAAGTGNTVLTTTNGGNTWSKVNIPASDESYYYRNMWFLDENIGFITGGKAGNQGVILKTINGGTSWTDLSTNSSSAIYGIYFTSPTTGYYSNFSGEISKTINGGSSWQKLSSGVTSSLISMFFTSETTGYAVGFQGTILKTDDEGETWDLTTTDTDDLFTDVVFLDENVGFIIGGKADNSSTIMKTTDGGQTWKSEATNAFRQFGGEFLSYAAGYSCGFDGSILKITNITASNNKLSDSQKTTQIYPNPASGYLTLDLGPNSTKAATVKILNCLGLQVYTGEFAEQQLNINLSSYGGSGIYYVIISDPNNPNESEVQKVILL